MQDSPSVLKGQPLQSLITYKLQAMGFNRDCQREQCIGLFQLPVNDASHCSGRVLLFVQAGDPGAGRARKYGTVGAYVRTKDILGHDGSMSGRHKALRELDDANDPGPCIPIYIHIHINTHRRITCFMLHMDIRFYICSCKYMVYGHAVRKVPVLGVSAFMIFNRQPWMTRLRHR